MTQSARHNPRRDDSIAGDKRYRIAIRRPVAVAMVFVTLLVFGWRSYQELPLDLMPEISYPTLTVRTEYADAAPEDVERLVTRPLEERLSIVSGVVEITSISSAGLSEVILEFTWGTDMNTALQDVRESLDLFDPPSGVTQRPVILRYDPTLDPVMRVALITGSSPDGADPLEPEDANARLTEIRRAAEEHLKGDIEAEPGIAQVLVRGGRETEIQVQVDAENLKSLGLTVSNVVDSLRSQNINLSGGRLLEGRTEYLVRTLNEFRAIDEIGDTVIRSGGSDPASLVASTLQTEREGDRSIRLRDIARIYEGDKDRESIVRINGREAVNLEFYKEGNANVVQVCESLKDFLGLDRRVTFGERVIRFAGERFPTERTRAALERMERRAEIRDKLQKRLPDYTEAILVTDQSRFVVASIREVQSTALFGGLLALAILYIFLRKFRTTGIVSLAIPISVVSTFVPMFIGDVTLNIMSLGGIALGIGMLVDNSVVVLESIFRCSEEGDELMDAAERGTREVGSAVFASTLTTIAVFFPMVFVEGIAGQLFRDLALTVTFSVTASLVVALFLIPMVASRKGLALERGRRAVPLLSLWDGRHGEGGFFERLRLRTREAIARSWRDTVGRAFAARVKKQSTTMIRALWAVLIPVLFLLFVVQLALQIAGGVLSTVAFCVASLLILLGLAGGLVFRAILTPPMWLFDKTFQRTRDTYVRVLRAALPLSPIVLAALVFVSWHAYQTATELGRELIPPMKQGEFGIEIETPPGTRLEETDEVAASVAALARNHPDVETVMAEVGKSDVTGGEREGENVARLTVRLKDPERTAARQDAIMDSIRADIQRSISHPATFTLPSLFSFREAVEARIYGEDLDMLRRLGGEALERLDGIVGLKDADLGLRAGYPEVHVVLDRQLLAEKGLTPNAIADALQNEVQGDVATRFSRGAEKVDIRVRAARETVRSVHDLRALSITDGYPPTPLGAVAEITTEEGPSEIRRADQHRVALITANVEGRDLGSVTREIEDRMLGMNWPDGYGFSMSGQQTELATSYGGLLFALGLAVFLVYVVMACQFESLWHPALIMFSVPLAFIGVIYVLDLLNMAVSVVVFIGGIVLAGIVVNNAIVLVDYVNQLRARGLTKAEAVVEAGQVRFRPIMMTTATTVLGLLPMALSGGEGAEIRQPMAITVMAGLTAATVLTLIIIPMVYYMFGGSDPEQAARN